MVNPELMWPDAGLPGKKGCRKFPVRGNLGYWSNRHQATSVPGYLKL
jgi:hypothetical protein